MSTLLSDELVKRVLDLKSRACLYDPLAIFSSRCEARAAYMVLVSLAPRSAGHDRTAERLFSSQLAAQSAQLPLIYASAPASDEMGFPPPGLPRA